MSEFLVSGSATDAARRAGYSVRCAHAVGHKVLRLPNVQAALAKEEGARLAELRVTADRLDARLARIAFAESGAELDQLGCSGRDAVAAIKLLYERLGLLEQRHVIETRGRVGFYTSDPASAVDLDAADADTAGVVFMIPKNGRDPGT